MGIDHYENFPVGSVLVPKRLRAPIHVIYRFARGADDIVDEGDAGPAERLQGLAAWRDQLARVAAGKPPAPEPEAGLFAALGTVIERFGLPESLFADLLDAFAQDVVKTRYTDIDDLLDYCRRSANPVGRLLLGLYRVDDEVSLRQSDAICSALQLINFWQDVAVDRDKSRVYIPQDTLHAAGFPPGDAVPAGCDDRLRRALAFEVVRARRMMVDGAPLAVRLGGRLGWELRLVVQGGLRILERIEAVDYDVFARRPALGKVDWMLLAARALAWRLPPVE
jgi:phytoene synthase